LCPRPIPEILQPKDSKGRVFVAKQAAVGSRHTIVLMINYIPERGKFGRKSKKLMFFGLNQGARCEEPGIPIPEEISWDHDKEPPVAVGAGYGNSYIITKSGDLWSFGLSKFGTLGHGDEETWQIPRRVKALDKVRVRTMATGKNHVCVITYDGRLYTWGRNNKGQLGRGHFSRAEILPDLATEINTEDCCVNEVSCGEYHTVAVVKMRRKDNSVGDYVYAWGDQSEEQLSYCDAKFSHTPKHLRWVTKFLEKNSFKIKEVACGGFHNMLLLEPSGQVLVWGAGGYGQLGSGFGWNDPEPSLVPNLTNAISIAAGLRTSFALCQVGGSAGGIPNVYAWGDNSSGQLGLGDLDLRLVPTQVTACRQFRVKKIVAGDRHTIFISQHIPLTNRDRVDMKEYYKVLENGGGSIVKHRLKVAMKRSGLDPKLLDNPDGVMEGQAGTTANEAINDQYEDGLKYCMDTKAQLPRLAWRRKGYETAYKCPSLKLESVCMVCARRCHKGRYLELYLRRRTTGDPCDCFTSGQCDCAWNLVRHQFDKVAEKKVPGRQLDGKIGPNNIREVLSLLRAPIPIDASDVEECMIALKCAEETDLLPRIRANVFEKWYREHFQEFLEDEVHDEKKKKK
jgi:hypothetical protein